MTVTADAQMAGRRRRRRRPDAVQAAVAVLALAAFAVSMVVQRHWFPHLSKDNDEPVYLFQADLFRHGMATLPAQAIGRNFRPWMSGPIGDRLIMVFPPGWPLVLAVGRTLFGSWRVVGALAAAAVVVAVYAFARELLRDRVTALIAVVLVAGSPMLIMLTGTVLSYPFALATDAALGAFALRAVRLGRPRMLLGTGVAAAVLFSMRPVDAGILTVVFGSYVLWSWRRRISRLLRGAGWAALGAAPVLTGVLVYNARVTGHPLRFPLQAQGGDNRFGFGKRFITQGAPVFNVTPSMMWKVTLTLLGELPRWLSGGFALLPLAAVGMVVLWRRHGSAKALVLVGLAVGYPVAHFFYWGTYFVTVGRREYGPFYYLPMLLPLCLAAATAIRAAAARWRGVGYVAVGGLVAGGLGFVLPPKLALARRHTTIVSREIAVVGRLPKPAVVILPADFNDGPWILHVRGYFANRPHLGGDRIFAAEDGAANVALFDRFPRLPVYELSGLAPPGHPDRPPVPETVRLERTKGTAADVAVRFTNPTLNPTVVAYAATPGYLDRCLLDESSVQGKQYTVRWTITATGATPSPECSPLPRQAMLETLSGHLLVGVTAAGNTDFDGVDRWERFYSMHSSPDGLELLTPGLPRRTAAGDQGDPLSLFYGAVDDVLDVQVAVSSPR